MAKGSNMIREFKKSLIKLPGVSTREQKKAYKNLHKGYLTTKTMYYPQFYE